MSKRDAVLAKVDEIARRLGAGHLADTVKREIAAVWGAGSDEARRVAPAAPATDTFNVQVGVEVLRSTGARQSDVEAAVKQALETAASRRNEVVSISVAGA